MNSKGKLRRLIFNFLWVILVALILFFATGVIVTKKYGDELEQITINQINQHINTKLSVEDVEISFFSRFPFVSVVFQDVMAWSSNDFDASEFLSVNTDTLFSAEKIYLQLNIFDVIRGNFNVKRIYSINGKLNLLTDSSGKTNYQVFKNKTEANKEKTKVFELEGMRISDFSVHLSNMAKDISSNTQIKELLLKGRFQEGEFGLGVSSHFEALSFQREGVSYLNNSELYLKSVVEVKEKIARITKGDLRLNGIGLRSKGEIDFNLTPNLTLFLEGRSMDVEQILKEIRVFQKRESTLEAHGNADVAFKITGPVSTTRSPNIKAVYVLNLSDITFRDNVFKNLRLKGKYDNGKFNGPASTLIEVSKFSLIDRNSDLEGSFSLKNLLSPEITLNINGFFDSKELNNLGNFEKIRDFSGIIQPDFELSTSLSSLREFKISSIVEGELRGSLQLVNLNFETGRDKFRSLNGELKFKDDRWLIDIEMDYNECPVWLKAEADYLLAWLTKENQALWARAALKTGDLKLQPFSKKAKDTENTKDRKSFYLPANIFIHTSLTMSSFEYGKFKAENIISQMSYKPGALDLDSYSMKSNDGDIDGKLSLYQDKKGKIFLKTQNDIKNLNIEKVFYSFNNFNQEFIKDENLKGSLSGDVQLSMSFDTIFRPYKNEINSNINISLLDGELNNFEPAKRLSKFIEINELENIKFSELKNNILINNNTVLIPEMSINSSAFDITASGTHNFDNYFDYKVKVNLSEILSGKAKNKLENQENFVIEEGGSRASLFLSISGTPEDFKVKYDRLEAMKNIRESMKEEKNTLKNILNEEFGWFKKDSSILEDTKIQNEPVFKLDWEEENKDSLENKRRKKRKKRVEKEEVFEIEWDEDDGR
jgi:hypothetical protein